MTRYLENSIPRFSARHIAGGATRARRALHGAAFWAAVLLGGPAAPANAQTASSSGEPVVVRMGSTGFTATDWPQMVAIQKGFFSRHGVDFQVINSQKATINVQSLIGGSLNFVSSGVDSAILPIEYGADLVAVAGIENLLVMQLVGGPGIKSIMDLQGKKLAISRTNGPDVGVLRDFMGSAGLKIDPGLFVIAGGTASRLAAVVNGGTSATMLVPPDGLRAAKEGLTDLGLNVGRSQPRQFVVLITNRTWARQNTDAVVKTLRGLVDALHWLNDPANRQEAAQILMSHTNVDKEMAQYAYDVLVTETHSYSREGEFNTAGIQTVLKDIVSVGAIKEPIPPVSKYIDTSFLERALKR